MLSSSSRHAAASGGWGKTPQRKHPFFVEVCTPRPAPRPRGLATSVAPGVDDRPGDGRGIGEPDLVAALALDQAIQAQLFREARVPRQAVWQSDVEPAVDVALADPHGGERLL